MTTPIPMSCAGRPTTGGLVAPYVNIQLADGGTDFRSPDTGRYTECWEKRLCQTCGNGIGRTAVLFGGPNQVRSGRFDEPPLCPPCALYASSACPMVAGRQPFYADRVRLSETKRGHVCWDSGCSCGGYTPSDPNSYDASGEPAHNWYAAYVTTGTWRLTVHDVEYYCSDGGCSEPHIRRLVNGCWLNDAPRKVVLVSTTTGGRVWRRLSPDELSVLLTPQEGESCPISSSNAQR